MFQQTCISDFTRLADTFTRTLENSDGFEVQVNHVKAVVPGNHQYLPVHKRLSRNDNPPIVSLVSPLTGLPKGLPKGKDWRMPYLTNVDAWSLTH
jgi:hypothetical protein